MSIGKGDAQPDSPLIGEGAKLQMKIKKTPQKERVLEFINREGQVLKKSPTNWGKEDVPGRKLPQAH